MYCYSMLAFTAEKVLEQNDLILLCHKAFDLSEKTVIFSCLLGKR